MTNWSITSDPHITDDLIATREEDGVVHVWISTWVHPAQRLALLAWLGELLDTEPCTALALRISAGATLGRTRTLAGGELADLMDRPKLSAEQRARALDLICASR